MMRRASTFSFVLAVAALMAGCDTVTDLGEVRLDGEWYSVGALQQSLNGTNANLLLRLDDPNDGTVSGTWLLGGSNGSVTEGTRNGQTIQFTLEGFNGGSVVFAGELTNRFRLEGTLEGYPLDGTAVFRFGTANGTD
jgi:hypothetical protein